MALVEAAEVALGHGCDLLALVEAAVVALGQVCDLLAFVEAAVVALGQGCDSLSLVEVALVPGENRSSAGNVDHPIGWFARRHSVDLVDRPKRFLDKIR